MASMHFFTPPRAPLQPLQHSGGSPHALTNPSSSPCAPSSPLNPYSAQKGRSSRSSLSSSGSATLPSNRKAQYKARRPAYSLAPAPEPPVNGFLRDKIMAKCAERVAKDREKAKEREKRKYASSSSEAGSSDVEMSSDGEDEDDTKDEVDDSVGLRVLFFLASLITHFGYLYIFSSCIRGSWRIKSGENDTTRCICLNVRLGRLSTPMLRTSRNGKRMNCPKVAMDTDSTFATPFTDSRLALEEIPDDLEGYFEEDDEQLLSAYEDYLNSETAPNPEASSPQSTVRMESAPTPQAKIDSRNHFLNHLLGGQCPQCHHSPLSISTEHEDAVTCGSCRTTYPLGEAATSWVEDHPAVDS